VERREPFREVITAARDLVRGLVAAWAGRIPRHAGGNPRELACLERRSAAVAVHHDQGRADGGLVAPLPPERTSDPGEGLVALALADAVALGSRRQR
jgi:hypothetical protein